MGKIEFGILINANINNKYFLNDAFFIKIDCFNYIREIHCFGYINDIEAIESETKLFKDTAKEIKEADGMGIPTEFFLVAYYKNNRKIEIRKIRELYLNI